ncbi:acyl CoA:acetate/3-ketoacid CoA transferase [Hominifimenecus sp. rT4P-3]|uniref:acyl CoA:acetate/3-ketoacid CoA transferase n=1 Tax=Hominifimenecus sp. rT4P-3 TaxID=3242979 RepID=UPI003DA539A1
MQKPRKNGKRVPILTANEAVSYIPNQATIAFLGAGGGICEATEVIQALAERYRETKEPNQLTYYHATGLGDRADKGMSPLAQEGMVKRIIGGHWGQSPRLAEMAERNEIEAYNFPQGVISQLLRASAAGQPGLMTRIGLGTFVDPREKGGKLNECTKEDLIERMEIKGEEYLFYPTIPIDVAIIRATTADTEGYVSMEDEVAVLDALAMAQAAHNNHGLVICQVQRVVAAGTIHPKQVRIPGYCIDILVEVPDQPQMYQAPVDRFISGDFRKDTGAVTPLPLNERKVIARRALMEASPGAVGNVGVGIADGIGIVAREEGIGDQFTLTVETGPIGGATAQGIFFGASINMRALLDMPSQFDFYDGGGLDVCYLSFAELDQQGNVNVHKFNGKIMGTGGFINIHQNTKKLVFCGTLTAGKLRTSVEDGSIRIVQEGKHKKLVKKVEEITFNGRVALDNDQEVWYLTERAVFRLTKEGLELCEVAPGIDIERDVISQMEFRPLVSEHLRKMDARLFSPEVMGLKDEQPWNQIGEE